MVDKTVSQVSEYTVRYRQGRSGVASDNATDR
jgi:hypothetical protein